MKKNIKNIKEKINTDSVDFFFDDCVNKKNSLSDNKTKISTKRQIKFIQTVLDLTDDFSEPSNLNGFLVRSIVQATFPHTNPNLPPLTGYKRSTGLFELTVTPTNSSYGVPYGAMPRIILAYICTEAVKNKNKTIYLGKSQRDFMKKLGLHINGRDAKSLMDQMKRLLHAVISINYKNKETNEDISARMLLSNSSHIFWNAKDPDIAAKWTSQLVLSSEFYEEIIKSPVPLDLNIYKALRKSPLAMDMFAWLMYRLFALANSKKTKPFVKIPWKSLKDQFGTGYPDTDRGIRHFKENFILRWENEVKIGLSEAIDYVHFEKDYLKLIRPNSLKNK